MTGISYHATKDLWLNLYFWHQLRLGFLVIKNSFSEKALIKSWNFLLPFFTLFLFTFWFFHNDLIPLSNTFRSQKRIIKFPSLLIKLLSLKKTVYIIKNQTLNILLLILDYPCPLLNILDRPAVYDGVGRTILDLLAVRYCYSNSAQFVSFTIYGLQIKKSYHLSKASCL